VNQFHLGVYATNARGLGIIPLKIAENRTMTRIKQFGDAMKAWRDWGLLQASSKLSISRSQPV
jgi:hypothetical protein